MRRLVIALAILALAAPLPVAGQFGPLKDKLDKAQQKAKPVTDRAQKLNDIKRPWTPEEEQAFGEASAAKLISIFGLYENPDMMKYVNLVGNTVAKQGARTDTQYHFGILDTDVVNAMAMPGGFIFVTRGALSLMDNESELAGVLAHEVAHVDARHLEKEIKQKGLMSMGTSEAKNTKAAQSAANQIPGGQAMLNFATNAVTQLLTAPYGRAEESDADKKGLDFASKAGYAPVGLRDFLQALADKQAENDPDAAKRFSLLTSTHPKLPERVASLTALLPSYTQPGEGLQDRFSYYVNTRTFAGATPAAADTAAKAEAAAAAKAAAAKRTPAAGSKTVPASKTTPAKGPATKAPAAKPK